MSFPHGLHTYDASCLCGEARFSVSVDLDQGTSRCNCTTCIKRGTWSVRTTPEQVRFEGEAFELYSRVFGDRYRCRSCRTPLFSLGDQPALGGAFAIVNVRLLDGVDLSGVQVAHLDGRHDTWAFLRQTVEP